MTPDALQRNWYTLKFENTFLRVSGQAFEDLFSALMGHRFPGDFEKVRPNGKAGDLKCDGYRTSDRTVFQCYAPNTPTLAKLLRKMDTDFLGAVGLWGPRMRRWEFVHNQDRGLPPEATQRLVDFRDAHPDVHLAQCTLPELQRLVFELPLGALEALLGPAPSLASFGQLAFADLKPVLLAIGGTEPEFEPPLVAPSPDKLERNALGEEVGMLLRIGRRKESLVQSFLARWPDPTLGESIAERFRNEYAELKAAGRSPDQIFGALQRFAGGDGGEPAHQGAVLAVMSYFFERCDIFEDVAVARSIDA